jgi:hypothetical protein
MSGDPAAAAGLPRHPPMTPPSVLRITMAAERGRPPAGPSGHAPTARGAAGLLRSLAVSPGCWTLTNMLVPSGVVTTPVISEALGPVRKRRISRVAGSAASI